MRLLLLISKFISQGLYNVVPMLFEIIQTNLQRVENMSRSDD